MKVVPVVLEGVHVRLEPLALDHVADLARVGLDPELWRFTTQAISTIEDMQRYVEVALAEAGRGESLPFVTVSCADRRVVGSTRFASIRREHGSVEIGWTFVARDWQRSSINTEAKLLMLRHAFEVWGCMRVELKTDALNDRSRTAILRLGAKEEGILRRHMYVQGGRVRDSVLYSVIDTEWPPVKARLLGYLSAHPGMPQSR